MDTIAEKLQYTRTAINNIQEAIIEYGIDLPATIPLGEYADKIRAIQSNLIITIDQVTGLQIELDAILSQLELQNTVVHQKLDAQDSRVNMALASKATVHMFSATLSNQWTGSTAPYSQIVSVPGLLATDTPILDLIPSATFATAKAQIEAWVNVFRAVTSNGGLTVYATEASAVTLPVQLKVVR